MDRVDIREKFFLIAAGFFHEAGSAMGVNFSIVLENQLEASERSARQLDEKMSLEHEYAMLCFDVQDLIKSTLFLLEQMNEGVEKWQQKSPQEIEKSGLTSKNWYDVYVRISEVLDKLWAQVHALEKVGYSADGKERLRRALRDVRMITCFDPQRVASAVSQAQRGEGCPLRDIERDLSRSVNA